jgi:hypothetical protein
MYRWAAIVAFFLQAVLRAVPQQRPEPAAEPIILKSTSHAVQLDVIVSDASGNPVHGLQKNDFVVTDNGHPRDIRIFGGDFDANRTGVYSNRLGMRDSRIVTAIVIDAVPRPDGMQKNDGIFGWSKPAFWFSMVRGQAMYAINRMEPGQIIAIYAACPDLRIVQDYTFDPDRLVAGLKAFVPPHLPDAAGKQRPSTMDALVPPMLSALRDVAVECLERPAARVSSGFRRHTARN